MAFAERFVMAVALDGAGGPRVAMRTLDPGLLEPSSRSPNIHSVRDVARLATEALDELGPRPRRLAVVLPDLCVPTTLFPPSRSESERDLLASFRSKLPFPESEARSDAWRGSDGERLAAAVRLGVVRQYEQVVEAAGCALGWVDAASLAALPGWIRENRMFGDALALRVLLYPSHYSIAVFRGRELVGLRTKLRVPGDADAVAFELRRVPGLYGARSLDRVYLAGSDADECAGELRRREAPRELLLGETSERALLVSSVAALLGRG